MKESLALFRELGNQEGILKDLEGLAALEVYRELLGRLHEELNAEPDAAAAALFEHLQQKACGKAASLEDLGERRLRELNPPERVHPLRHPELPAVTPAPPLKSLEVRPNNLPASLTPLIGRQREVDTARELLRRQSVRLLTLTGAGGTGKTRLALQLAADRLDDFSDGAFCVDLAPIRDPELVTATIAQTLGIRESGHHPLWESLKAYLAEKQLLLVLDNFEQVLPAAARVVELLQAAPGLKVLVTSREALHVSGEQEFPVPPLSVPEAERRRPVSVLGQYGAVALFVQRAAQAKPEFALTEANAVAVAEICRRLDGLPLALELAAARVKLFAPEALLSRLANPLKLLVGGARDRPSRQQTLRETIQWSYHLLNGGERRLFRRLCVFVGGCTLEATEAVCSPDGELETELLEGVASLVDKSLLQQAAGPAGEPRFWMLETIREYGAEALRQSGEEPLLRRRHRDWFLALAEQAVPEYSGREAGAWLERLETEHDNLRAALEWSGQYEPEGALRLAGALWRFWMGQGCLGEGRERLGAALRGAERRAELRRSGMRAAALDAAGVLAYQQGDYTASRSLLEESLALFRELEDKGGIALCLTHLGLLAYFQGDYTASRSLLEESLAMLSELGDRKGMGLALNALGRVAYEQGDYVAARSLPAESLTIFRETGHQWGIAASLDSLGRVVYDQGDYSAARSLHAESLTIRREMGNKLSIAEPLESLARLAAQGREWERAVRLWGAAAALRETIGAPRSPLWRAEWERDLGAARAALGEEAFAAAWAAGRALPLEEAVAYALESHTFPEDAVPPP
jgi:predicted ATPase